MVKVSKFFLPYIFILMLIGFKYGILIEFLFIMLHEIVHYIVAVTLGYSGFDMEILPIGTVLKLKNLDETTPKEDFIISISAPAFNLILAAIFYFFYRYYKLEYLQTMCTTNLILGIFNLVPAFPLDGGRILRDLLCKKVVYRKANSITIKISIGIGVFFMLLYIGGFLSNRGNVSIGLVAIFIIVLAYKEYERTAYIIMGDIMKKRCGFLNKGYIEIRSICIYYRKDLLFALSMVDKNKYSIFYILDEDMKTMDIIYEEEIVEALKRYGNISIEEYINES